MNAQRPVLAVMVKEPVMGRVKSRLFADIGPVAATAFQRSNIFATVRRLAIDPRWQIILAVAPDAAMSSAVLPDLPRLPQGAGDLGSRMASVFRVFPNRDVLIIGADIAAIRPRHIADCLRAVRRHGAVLAASGDGGYWLVGVCAGRRPMGLFDGVRWSTRYALSDSAAAFRRSLGIDPACGPERYDVDNGQDHARWRADAAMRTILPVRA